MKTAGERATLALVVAERALAALWLLLLAFFHVQMEPLMGPYVERLTKPWFPALVAGVFVLLALLHIAELLRLLLRRPPSPSRFYPNWWIRNWSFRGRHYELVLMIRETAEIAIQTSVMFEVASAGVSAPLLLSYGGLLAANCLISPLLLGSQSAFVRRDLSVLLDTVFDTGYSVVWPFVTVWDMASALAVCDGVISPSNLAPVVQMNGVGLALVVSGPWDLVQKLVPLLSVHLLLRSVSAALLRRNRKPAMTAVVPLPHEDIPPSVGPRAHRLFSAVTVAYGLAVLAVVAQAAVPRCDGDAQCSIEGHPLLAADDRCHCLVYDVECRGRGLSGAAAEAELDAAAVAYASSLRIINATDCALAAVPASVARMPALWMLWLNVNELTDDSVGAYGHLPELWEAHFDDNRLTRLPELPPSSLSVYARNNALTALDARVAGMLSNIISLDVTSNAVAELSCELLRRPWVKLSLTNNSLAHVPDCVDHEVASAREFLVGGNNVSALPPSLLSDSSLEHLYAYHNPVCAAGDGLPSGRAYDAVEACAEPCELTCPGFWRGDGYCDFVVCQSEECGFDGGDCEDMC